MSLDQLGWNDHFAQHMHPLRQDGLEPARVAREERDRCRVLGATGECQAVVSGRLRHAATARAELPAVGDWVALRATEGGGAALIEAVLPRVSAFVRKVAGETTEEQIVAANVDVVFVIAGLDGDLNPRRIERYLAAAWDSGATPVVVLNKADLAGDLEARRAEVELAAPGAPVVAVSALESSGLEALEPWLEPGRTVALLGSSGVGKSTLVNALLGAERQSTGEVRAGDSRGRHTTTHRELIVLPGGAVLVDTPGMRELGLWADESSLSRAFPDIEALAAACRFRDCRHETEPGCEVLGAVRHGRLAPERLASWRKLQRELRYLAAKQDVRLEIQEQAKWRAITRSVKRHPKLRARGW